MGVGSDGTIEVFNSHGYRALPRRRLRLLHGGHRRPFTPLTPARLFDTRTGRVASGPARCRAGTPIDVQVAGTRRACRRAVPRRSCSTSPSPSPSRRAGCGARRPARPPAATSNVNFGAGDTSQPGDLQARRRRADHGRRARHRAARARGRVRVLRRAGQRVCARCRRRDCSTRGSGSARPRQPLAPGRRSGSTIGGQPPVPADATAVVLNVTATNVAGPSFVTVWPDGEIATRTRATSTCSPARPIANLVICRLGDGGRPAHRQPGRRTVT